MADEREAPTRPSRKSIRLQGYDYAEAGSYFVTICTADRRPLFGTVVDAQMRVSTWGQIAQREWPESVSRRPHIRSVAFVVMPNHVHGLVVLDPTGTPASSEGHPRLLPKSLGSFVNGYKGAVTKAIREVIGAKEVKVWQDNYHDRIVRNEREFDTILEYIENNPDRWNQDRFNNDL